MGPFPVEFPATKPFEANKTERRGHKTRRFSGTEWPRKFFRKFAHPPGFCAGIWHGLAELDGLHWFRWVFVSSIYQGSVSKDNLWACGDVVFRESLLEMSYLAGAIGRE